VTARTLVVRAIKKKIRLQHNPCSVSLIYPTWSNGMRFYVSAMGLLAAAMLASCASTNVTQQTPMTAPGLARPNQIWVYDFVAAPSHIPANSALAGRVGAPSTPPTPEEIETGRKYGAVIAQRLVEDIQAMGMPAIVAGPGSAPQVGDAVIRGYIV